MTDEPSERGPRPEGPRERSAVPKITWRARDVFAGDESALVKPLEQIYAENRPQWNEERRAGRDELRFEDDLEAQAFVARNPDGAGVRAIAAETGLSISQVQNTLAQAIERLQRICATPSPLAGHLRRLWEAAEEPPDTPGSPGWDPLDPLPPARPLEPARLEPAALPSDDQARHKYIHPYEHLSDEEWLDIAQRMEPGVLYSQEGLERIAGRQLPTLLGYGKSPYVAKRLVVFEGSKARLPALGPKELAEVDEEVDRWWRSYEARLSLSAGERS